jgi:hypothetical protein
LRIVGIVCVGEASVSVGEKNDGDSVEVIIIPDFAAPATYPPRRVYFHLFSVESQFGRKKV